MITGDLLNIDLQELQFAFELNKQISCTMQLLNQTDHYVAFKVKTTNQNKYIVRPSSAIVLPRSTCAVTVTMLAQKEAPPDIQCRDKFLVQSAVASPGATAKDITPELFNKESGNQVDEYKLKVNYIVPRQPPSPGREKSEEGSSSRASISNNGAVNSVDANMANVLISKLTEEKKSAIQQTKMLQQVLTNWLTAKLGSVFGNIMKFDEVVIDETKENNIIAASGDATSEKHQMVLDNVYELLQCPVCTTLMSPPIQQCPSGHTLCSICKIRLQSQCPVCRAGIGNIRCLALEKVAEPLQLPYDCPYARPECLVTGNISQLVTHLQDNHNVSTHNMFNFKHRYVQSHSDKSKNARGMICLFNCHERQFCYHFEAFLQEMNPFYIGFLRFMGENSEAKKFSYSLELRGNGRTMSWKGVPRSIRYTYQKVCDDLDGLVIPWKVALLFSEGNEEELKLQVYGHIRIETEVI